MIYIGKPHRMIYVQTRKQLVLERLRWLSVSDFYYDTSNAQTKAYYDELIDMGYARLYWEDDGAHAPARLITITDEGCIALGESTSLYERCKSRGLVDGQA
jgi:hypothetical protein